MPRFYTPPGHGWRGLRGSAKTVLMAQDGIALKDYLQSQQAEMLDFIRWLVEQESMSRDAAATVATMTADNYVNHVPVMTGGRGRDEMIEFYGRHFIPQMPADTALRLAGLLKTSPQLWDTRSATVPRRRRAGPRAGHLRHEGGCDNRYIRAARPQSAGPRAASAHLHDDDLRRRDRQPLLTPLH